MSSSFSDVGLILDQSLALSQALVAKESPALLSLTRATLTTHTEIPRGSLDANLVLAPQLRWGSSSHVGNQTGLSVRATGAATPLLTLFAFHDTQMFRAYIPGIHEALRLPTGIDTSSLLWNRTHLAGLGTSWSWSPRWTLHAQAQADVFHREHHLFSSRSQHQTFAARAALGGLLNPLTSFEVDVERKQLHFRDKGSRSCTLPGITLHRAWTATLQSEGRLSTQTCTPELRRNLVPTGRVQMSYEAMPWNIQWLAERTLDAVTPAWQNRTTLAASLWENRRMAWFSEITHTTRVPATEKIKDADVRESGLSLGVKWLPKWEWTLGTKGEISRTGVNRPSFALAAVAFFQWQPGREPPP